MKNFLDFINNPITEEKSEKKISDFPLDKIQADLTRRLEQLAKTKLGMKFSSDWKKIESVDLSAKMIPQMFETLKLEGENVSVFHEDGKDLVGVSFAYRWTIKGGGSNGSALATYFYDSTGAMFLARIGR